MAQTTSMTVFRPFPRLPLELQMVILNMALDDAAPQTDADFRKALTASCASTIANLPGIEVIPRMTGMWLTHIIQEGYHCARIDAPSGRQLFVNIDMGILDIMQSCRFAKQLGLEWLKHKVEEHNFLCYQFHFRNISGDIRFEKSRVLAIFKELVVDVEKKRLADLKKLEKKERKMKLLEEAKGKELEM